MNQQNKQFHISFLIKIDVGTDIKAESLEKAIEIAKTYSVKDVLDLDETHNDNCIKVMGAYDNSEGVNE